MYSNCGWQREWGEGGGRAELRSRNLSIDWKRSSRCGQQEKVNAGWHCDKACSIKNESDIIILFARRQEPDNRFITRIYSLHSTVPKGIFLRSPWNAGSPFFSFFSSLFFSRLFFFSFFPPTFFLLTKARCGRGRNSTTSHTLLELPHNLYFHLGNVPKSPIQLSSSCAFHQSARVRPHTCMHMHDWTHTPQREGGKEREWDTEGGGGGGGGGGGREPHTHTHTRLL